MLIAPNTPVKRNKNVTASADKPRFMKTYEK